MSIKKYKVIRSFKMEVKGSNFSKNNKAQIISGGKEYFDTLLRMIDDAQHTIHLQTYIFKNDETGSMVAEALKNAAKRKVEIYMMVDGYASQDLSKKFITDLVSGGIKFRYFEPILKSKDYYFGRRMHQKVFVSDSKFALLGGINIANHYNDIHGEKAWFDFAILMEGKIAYDLCILCWKTWRSFSAIYEAAPCLPYNEEEIEGVKLRMRRNDWVRRKNEISATYAEMLRHSTSHITFIGSYFLPGKFIRKLMSEAAGRGVEISVISAGKSDVKIFKNAERWMYDWLLRRNIKIYEYQPSILHAKIAVCDAEWFTIGSYNINNISHFVSLELNIDVLDNMLTAHMEQIVAETISNDCIQVTNESHKKSKNLFIQFIRWCSFQLLKNAFHLFTFYYKRQRKVTKDLTIQMH